MTLTAYAWLLAGIVIGAIALAACERFGVVDRIAHLLERDHPPAPRFPERPRNVRVYRNDAPRWQRSPCDMAYWDGPEESA